jgi:hypothetical protein
MATITDVRFCVVWSWTYTSVLKRPFGALVLRSGYSEAIAQADQRGWRFPWSGEGHWSRFWSAYLGGPERLRGTSTDMAWDRLVPLRWGELWNYGGPEAWVEMEAFLHPTAVTVIATVDASGSWNVTDLAQSIAELRRSRSYGRDGSGSVANRKLDGLALEMREAVQDRLLLGGALGEPAYSSTTTVTAALGGTGKTGELAVTLPAVQACIAGLAGLGPPGPMLATNLLPSNTNTNRSARIYCIGDGQAIWRPDAIITQPDNDPVGCLLLNHATGIGHIAGLRGLIEWAGDLVARNIPIDEAVHPLLERALHRLYQLHRGDKTYRSEALKVRIDPLLPRMDAIRAATGLGAG